MDCMAIKVECDLLFIRNNFFSINKKRNDIVSDIVWVSGGVSGHDGWVKLASTFNARNDWLPLCSEANIAGNCEAIVVHMCVSAGVAPVVEEHAVTSCLKHSVRCAIADLEFRGSSLVVVDAAIWIDGNSKEG